MTPPPASAVSHRPVYLVKGPDASLVAQATHELIAGLVGGGDPSMVVEEFGGPGTEHLDVGPVIDACSTPAFLVDLRVIVVREAGQMDAEAGKRLVAYLADPLPSTALVLVSGGGTIPAALVKAVGSSGEVVDTAVGYNKARTQWLADHLKQGPVRLDGEAQARLSQHLGSDMGRVAGLLDTLAAAYGQGATVSVAELEPFLGEAGSLAPWDLTDAIDGGRVPVALDVLHRMLTAGESHPLAILTVLHRHYRQMLRLDGSGTRTAEQAADVLGLKSTFPAKKALAQADRLGTDRIARAIQLLADADLDLRGHTGLSGAAVLEVLVARLSRLVAPRR